ncbi:MAG: ATP-binding protein [Vicinamibacterales bacterium]
MPERRWDRHGIRARVLLLQGAGWIVSLVLIGATGWLSLQEVRRQGQEARAATARVVAHAIDRFVADDLAAVQQLSGLPDLRATDGDVAPERAALRRAFLRTTVIASVALADADGGVVAREPAGGGQPPPTATEIRAALAGGRPVVRVERGTAGGAPSADLALLPWSVAMPGLPSGAAETPAAIRALLFGLAPFLIALGAVFAWGTAWSVRRPVLALTAAAERMGAGDLGTPLPVLPDDEIGRLGAALERLRSSLRVSLETIASHAHDLEQRVADRTRDLEQMCHRLHDRDTWRAELLRKVISAQEDERRRLARDLHDDACQSLAAVGVSLDLTMAEGTEATRAQLASVKALVNRALADLHRVIYDLRPSVLDDLGLLPAIRWLADQHLAARGISVRCEFFGLDGRLAPEVEIALFRVVQEAMANIERHAGAETVLVQVSLEDGLLTVEVEDDGVGFEPEAVADPAGGARGLGLLGMRERVELLGGSFFVDSAPGRGTRVVATVPAVVTREAPS